MTFCKVVKGFMKKCGIIDKLSRVPGFPGRAGGFSLVELMIAMAVGLVVLGAMYSVFTIQNKTFANQEEIVAMQQSVRAGMDMMAREIGMAGYAPTGYVPGGTMQRSDPTGANFVGIPYDANKLQIYADLNGDNDTNDPHEYIKYTMDSDYPFEIRRDTGGGRQEFALNIQTFTFDYLKADGVTKVTTSADNDKIRQIKITITGRTAKPDPANGGYRTYTLTSIVAPRNLAY